MLRLMLRLKLRRRLKLRLMLMLRLRLRLILRIRFTPNRACPLVIFWQFSPFSYTVYFVTILFSIFSSTFLTSHLIWKLFLVNFQ
jgi:hypothetical protein